MPEKLPQKNEKNMMNSSKNIIEEDYMLDEYDFTNSMPNKFAAKLI